MCGMRPYAHVGGVTAFWGRVEFTHGAFWKLLLEKKKTVPRSMHELCLETKAWWRASKQTKISAELGSSTQAHSLPPISQQYWHTKTHHLILARTVSPNEQKGGDKNHIQHCTCPCSARKQTFPSGAVSLTQKKKKKLLAGKDSSVSQVKVPLGTSSREHSTCPTSCSRSHPKLWFHLMQNSLIFLAENLKMNTAA